MENNINNNQAPQVEESSAPKGKKPFNSKLIIIIVAVVAVVVAICVGVAVIGGGKVDFKEGNKAKVAEGNKAKDETSSPTSPVDDYLEVMYKGDVSKIKKLAPDTVWEETDLDEIKEVYAEAFEEETEDYGKFKKLDYEITDKEEIDKDDDEFEEVAEGVVDAFDVDEDDVKKIYYLEVEGVAEYEDGEEEFEEVFYSVKVKGKWYLVHENGMPAYAGIVMIAAFYGADV